VSATTAALIEAGILLFGAPARAQGLSFLASLEPAAVRRAYRILAVASHPDTARRAGARGAADGRRFIEASKAYELLMGWLLVQRGAPRLPRAARTRPAPSAHPAASAKKRPRPAEAPHAGRSEKKRPRAGAETGGTTGPLFYRGAIPRRPLRLAEYLYYSGRVSWQSMIKAIVWQRSIQPKFGEIARELSRISAEDLWKILGSKLRHEQTGEAAQRLRILSAAEVERVLRLQRLRHRRIGAYFVEEERMSGASLTQLLRELYRHNARWGKGP
jgi:hypothetical protein